MTLPVCVLNQYEAVSQNVTYLAIASLILNHQVLLSEQAPAPYAM